VARVVNALSRADVLDNTALIFSDNGFFRGEHRIEYGKELVYEETVRIPLLLRGGDFPKGATADQFVANIDLAPTIVNLVDADAGLPMDGQSLLRLASDPNRATARTLLIEAPGFKAARNKFYVYVEHNSGERELYDMRRGQTNYDPYQLKSRHAGSVYSQSKAELASKLNQLHTCSGASCIVP
jgi:N-acetylglucosamine-6-sulfatase